MSPSISKLNESIWNRKYVVRGYRSQTDLFRAEAVILDQIAKQFQNKAILDIGIGAGRTTRHLLNISKNYVGIDYSHEMIRIAQDTFTGVELMEMDARNLSVFANGRFDLIWFSFNGIDCASHGDRLKMLREIHRVLHDDGAFVFSSHNRDSKVLPAYDLRNIRSRLSANPAKLAKGLAAYLLGIYNSIRLKPREIHDPEYAIINDPSYCYSVLWYYISLEHQISCLKNCNFRDVFAFGLDGESLQANSSYDGPYIHYLARK